MDGFGVPRGPVRRMAEPEEAMAMEEADEVIDEGWGVTGGQEG